MNQNGHFVGENLFEDHEHFTASTAELNPPYSQRLVNGHIELQPPVAHSHSYVQRSMYHVDNYNGSNVTIAEDLRNHASHVLHNTHSSAADKLFSTDMISQATASPITITSMTATSVPTLPSPAPSPSPTALGSSPTRPDDGLLPFRRCV
ncbi:uncharacterized protein LOC117118163 [Anneissia japonica]|uniref:uncharacterized protein LOC117118163 n=1 Tax=Anneissia japonica TaxID=1529436 RepID=UPI00142577B7|nr:uncharacterized protein LOC117118163 [Anneissia japonica]